VRAPAADPLPTVSALRWWEARWFAALLLVAATIPLWSVPLPPLTDLPGHIGRFHIAHAITTSRLIARHWAYHWMPVGNLGADIAVQALATWLPIERAAWLVVAAIPPLWIGGLLLVSRESGGHPSPFAALALPLAYGFPFQNGFVNFMLSAGLAFYALALWIALGRRGRIALRAMLFVPLAALVWLAHGSGWALLVTAAFGADVARARGRDSTWPAALLRAGIGVAPMLPLPLIAILPAHGEHAAMRWDWIAKVGWPVMLLRERWIVWDVAGALLLLAAIGIALSRRGWRIDSIGGAAALATLAAYVIQPKMAMGGNFVDLRMLAPGIALALVSIRPPAALATRCAAAALAFATVRLATSGVALFVAAIPQQQALAAVPHLPRGAAVLVLVGKTCEASWAGRRLDHIADLAIARREIFDNSEWMLAGQQLLDHRHARAGRFSADPSQLVFPPDCPYQATRMSDAIATFDRGTFGYVWTIDLPARARLAPDVRLIWSNAISALYVVGQPTRGDRRPHLLRQASRDVAD